MTDQYCATCVYFDADPDDELGLAFCNAPDCLLVSPTRSDTCALWQGYSTEAREGTRQDSLHFVRAMPNQAASNALSTDLVASVTSREE